MKDTYTLITDRIIAELESGTIPWHKPWTCAQPAISHTTGKAYSLLNQLLLGGRSGEYLTFNQAKKRSGRHCCVQLQRADPACGHRTAQRRQRRTQ